MEDPNIESKKDEIDSYKILTFKSYVPNQYKSFVFSRWLHSLRFGSEVFKHSQSDQYYASYGKYIESLLSKDSVCLRIAVLAGDEDTALGWSVCEGYTLHYVYVKPEVRNLGIAKSLVPQGIKTFSHLTNIGLAIWQDKHQGLIFNPFSS
jgi:hypothetical protein